MFTEMIASLQHGEMPEQAALQGRLRAAMVKKLAMLRLEYQFRHNDSKINPDTGQMVWAAVLLGDQQSLDLLADILLTEWLDQAQFSPTSLPAPTNHDLLHKHIQDLRHLTDRTPLSEQIHTSIEKITNNK